MSKEDTPRTSSGLSDHITYLSRASVGRFSLYLRCVQQLHDDGIATVSSSRLGDILGITDVQVRKDLANLGTLGQRGVGYPTQELAVALRSVLGMDRQWTAVLVGAGNLARALLRYRGFEHQGFHIVALFDTDTAKIGDTIEGIPIHPADKIANLIADTGAELALLTVPPKAAQAVAEQLADAGIRGILNFAPVVLRLPRHVQLVTVDLSVQLEQLASLVHLGSMD